MKTSLILLTIKQNSNFVINNKKQVLFSSSLHIIGKENIIEVPHNMDYRASNTYNGAIIILFLSLVLLSITRISSSYFILTLSKSIYKNRNVEKINYEEYPLSKTASLCLILNYLISFSTILFFYLREQTLLDNQFIYLIALGFPLLFLFTPYLFLTFVEFIAGESQLTNEIKLTNWVICKFVGLLFSITLIVWIFNQHSHLLLTQSISYVLIGISIFRLIRGFNFAFSKGLPWYYIILYFCTFEILPVYLAWLFIQGNI